MEVYSDQPQFLPYIPALRSELQGIHLGTFVIDRTESDPHNTRVAKPLQTVKNHLFDAENGIYTLKEGKTHCQKAYKPHCDLRE